MAALKYSRQREAIRKQLVSRCDHPTAEMIFNDLRRTDPRISLGTVYRNLALLEKMGDLRRISDGDGPDHFDGNMTEHGHFICRSCGTIYDYMPGDTEDLQRKAADELGSRVDEIVMTAYGICRGCLEEKVR